jgi:hypothetical protein
MNPMKDALMKRRGKGIDITILLGGKPSDEEDRKTTDLAPKGEPLEVEEIQDGEDHGDKDEDKLMFEQMMADEQGKDALPEDYKPKSLGERAMMAAKLKGMGKK